MLNERPGLIAITGGGGFVGSAAARLLADRGYRVRLLVRRLPGAALGPGRILDIEIGDLDDRASLHRFLEGADLILHSAGAVKARRPRDFHHANARMTANLLEAAALTAPTARLIHISSLAAREAELSPYAQSKRESEIIVENQAGARPWVILRPPVIYGPGDLELLPLFQMAAKGFLLYPAARKARLAFLHVEDLAAAILALIEGSWPEGGRSLEIDDGQGGYAWPDILSAFAAAADKATLRAFRLPAPCLWPIAGAISLGAYLLNHPQTLALWKMGEIYHADWGSRSDPLPGWVGGRPLIEGLRSTWEWYRAQHYVT